MLNMESNKEEEHGSKECFMRELVPDECNPQTGVTSVRSGKSRRDTSRIKNPSKIFVGGIPGTGENKWSINGR